MNISSRELRAILSDLGMDVVPMRELDIHIEPDENGASFEENSYIKAKAILDVCHMPTIADDSGLMVDALNGEPGDLFGALRRRTQQDRPRPSAISARADAGRAAGAAPPKICQRHHAVDAGRTAGHGARRMPGRILTEPHGENGFGYDPVFYVPEQGCTFAELPAAEKNRISHRARALAAFAEKVKKENLYVNE